jgi:hypothetical protein
LGLFWGCLRLILLKMLKNMLHYSEIVKTVVLEPISVGETTLHYRIEICRGRAGQYFPLLWRKEFYRLQPTFPQEQGVMLEPPCDEEILVRDMTTVDLAPIAADDPEAALRMALQAIAKKFC